MSGYWLWACWLLFLIASFAVFEGIALYRGTPTLSRSVWTWQKNFPAFIGIAMFIAGFLFCHFAWGGSVNFNCPGQ